MSDFIQRSIEENHPATRKAIVRIGNQLDKEDLTGEELPAMLPPSRAAALNRGISNAVTEWNPATTNSLMNAAGKTTHHILADSIADVAPEIRPLNQRMQSLMPVVQRGTAADLNAGFTQRALGRFGAHTGALVGAAAGGTYGYREGGLPGAILGATAGIAAPELISSPEFQIGAARTFNSPALRKIAIPAMTGAGLQLDRKRRTSPFVE
jgi:hypothetical protein